WIHRPPPAPQPRPRVSAPAAPAHAGRTTATIGSSGAVAATLRPSAHEVAAPTAAAAVPARAGLRRRRPAGAGLATRPGRARRPRRLAARRLPRRRRRRHLPRRRRSVLRDDRPPAAARRD